MEVSDSVSDPSSSLLSSGNGSNWWALAGLRGGKGFRSVLRFSFGWLWGLELLVLVEEGLDVLVHESGFLDLNSLRGQSI